MVIKRILIITLGVIIGSIISLINMKINNKKKYIGSRPLCNDFENCTNENCKYYNLCFPDVDID